MHARLFLFVYTFQRIHFLSWPDTAIYLFYFIRLNFPKTSLVPDRSCCIFVLFHLSALSNNLCTSTHAPGRTSLTFARLAAYGHLFISTSIFFPTIDSDPMHRAGSWSQLCPNRVVATSKQNSNGEQYFPPTYRVVYLFDPPHFQYQKGKIIASNPSCWEGPNLTTFDRVRIYAIACRKGPSLTTRIAIAQIHVLQCTGQQTSLLF